jgi:two-component system LytT family response regulator
VRRRLAERDARPARPATASPAAFLERLFAHKGNRIVPLPVLEVTRVQACDDYCEAHCRGEAFLLPLRLQDLELRLDPGRFVRVHRSHLVNLDHVTQMRPSGDRRLEIELTDGSRIVASRSGSARLRDLTR